jgi:hypothetical protein
MLEWWSIGVMETAQRNFALEKGFEFAFFTIGAQSITSNCFFQ